MLSKQRKLGAATVALIAVMVCMLAFNIALIPGGYNDVAGAPDNALSQQATSGTFSKSTLDMTELRNQYIDQTIIQADIASFDGDRWVIVELEGTDLFTAYKNSSRYANFTDFVNSAEGSRLKANIQNAQADILNKITTRGIVYDYKYSYVTINNGIALKLNADAVNAVKKINGVKDVYYAEEYSVPQVEAVHNDANVYTTGIYNSEALSDVDGKSYMGEGMVVAILDTGLDYTHPAFNTPLANPENAKWSRETVAEKLQQIRASGTDFYAVGDVDDLYYSEKVPFMYDYADDDPDVFPSYSSHGTHVAGIVAGQDDEKIIDDKGNQDPSDDETFIGVAPQAQLAIFKVFTDLLESESLGGANSIDILRALNDCVALGVDVINMSLGTSCGFADGKSNGFLNGIYESIREAGISLVCAASNDYSSGFGGGNGTNLASNPDSATVGSPSTYAAALSVASINGQQSQYVQQALNENDGNGPVAFILNASDQYGKEIEFVDELYKKVGKKVGKSKGETMTFKYVVISGDGESHNYSTARRELQNKTYQGKAVDGTIAFIKRGKTTFEEKIGLAKSNGANAAIIYNNVSGTIRMSLGNLKDPIPSCSINMDAANAILERTNGVTGLIQVNSNMLAGPFMSDFSSWGPTPDLQIKPEITAHGGEITSAVASGNLGDSAQGDEQNLGGHAYDIYSGTSMASPNMAGAVALLRQYFGEKYPELKSDNVKLNDRVYQALMSTATIANNEEGNPYSPRKQGAGLADIEKAVKTEAYLTVGDINDPDSRTKCELGDDPERTGKYEITFNLINVTDVAQTYSLSAYVMTETLASDKKTVAEKAFMFSSGGDTKYATITYKADGNAVNGNRIELQPNGKMTITATVQLTQAAKDYMVESGFVNGMYVEGFVQLDNITHDNDQQADGVTLNIPYLAFYGDWNDAPLFDYDIYEISESEQNEEDIYKQLKSTAAATQVVGMYYNDEMILPMGQYIYAQDEDDVQVYPSRDKIALSRYDDRSSRTIYEIYAVWAGLLRNAAYMDIVIENAATGEVVYDFTRENVGKSYAMGGSNVGAAILLNLNPAEWGMNNNETYNVKVTGQLDYQNEEGDPKAKNPNKNTFEFTFAVDYEAPKLVDYTIRYQPIEVNNRITYRIWMDIDIYDNQYIMDVIPAYIEKDPSSWDGTYDYDEEGNITGQHILNSLKLMTEYPVPVTSSQKGATTTMSIEITDYFEDYVKTGRMYLQVEDYALNSSVYRIELDQESLNMPGEKIEFLNSDGRLTLGMGGLGYNDGTNKTGEYNIYDLTIKKNELYTLICPEDIDSMNKFAWRTRTGGSLKDCVKAKGKELFGAQSTNGSPLTLYLTDGTNKNGTISGEYIYAAIRVMVEDSNLSEPRPTGITLRPITADNGYITPASGVVDLNVNMEIPLVYELTPWYATVDSVEYTASGTAGVVETERTADNKNIIRNGILKTRNEGQVTITILGYKQGVITRPLSASFTVNVGNPFYVNSYTLYDCYLTGDVVVPDDLNIMYLSENCFRNNSNITSVTLPKTLTEIPRGAFMGCENLKKVTIQGQCTTIGMYAFRACPKLETIELSNYVNSKQEDQDAAGSIAIGQLAFENCPQLHEIINWERVTTIYDMAFMGCTNLQTVDLRALRVAGSGIFFGCTNLSEVKTSAHTQLGPNMFYGCESLENIKISGGNLPDGLFRGCTSLNNVDLSENTTCYSIGTAAFKGSGIQELTLPDCEVAIGADAFANCASLKSLTLGQHTKLNFDDSIITVLIDYLSTDYVVDDDDVLGEITETNSRIERGMYVNPFRGSEQFTEYKLSGGSDYYKVESGALYTSSGETVVSVPYGIKGYSLPTTVTQIGSLALAGLRADDRSWTVDISGVTEIGKFAFAQSEIASVTLPTNIEKLADGVFFSCAQLASVTNLDKFKEIGEFAFALDTNLSSIDIGGSNGVKTVGPYAFYNDSKLATVNGLNAVETIGESAFEATVIEKVDLQSAKTIGNYAFYNCFNNNVGLKEVKLGAVESFGIGAFASNKLLSKVEVGSGTTYIPRSAFTAYIETTENQSTGEITENVTHSITQVTLPDKIESIGDLAFAGAAITTINLANVTRIGAQAFYNTPNLTTLDLVNVEYIDEAAFYQNLDERTSAGGNTDGSNLTAINLPKAKYIGALAFANNAKITSITLGAAEYLGSNAFSNLGTVASVTLPATLKHTYDFAWYTFDEKGFYEQVQGSEEGNMMGDPRVRHMKAYSDGVFDGTAIGAVDMAGDFEEDVVLNGRTVRAQGTENYVSVEGVLYSRRYEYIQISESEVANYDENDVVRILEKPYARTFIGYQLEQYPAGNNATSYKPIDNTISIANRAFFGALDLTTVTLPYSVKTIGAGAFLNTGIKNYVFECVQAPELISAYIEVIANLLGTDFYNNFCPSDVYSGTGDIAGYGEIASTFFADERQLKAHLSYIFEDNDAQYRYYYNGLSMLASGFENGFGINATVPRNGTGYETPVWNNFFGKVARMDVDMPDVTTHDAINAINSIRPVAEISAFKNNTWENFVASGVREEVKAARVAYNKISDVVQLRLAAQAQTTLVAAELAVREVSKALGHAVAVESVAPSEYVRDYEYKTDKFDPTGLKLMVTFEDGSIITVEGDDVTFTDIQTRSLELGNGIQTNQYYVTGKWTDENGKEWEVDFIVNVRNTDGEPNPGGDEEGNKLSAGAIAGIAVGAVAAVVIIVLAAVLIALRSKRKAKGGASEEAKTDAKEVEEKEQIDVAADDENAENVEANTQDVEQNVDQSVEQEAQDVQEVEQEAQKDDNAPEEQ